ncbi:glycosyltransferase involved in cell wall biosynthesis [Amycolatopsis echigonensis]|uniref:Glycosyltransferase involved in cell wall biosynthesis n=1 Tax=Amycolatopsis echigonensis TaxID=2576905 RepID=A0A2N3WPV2_9PSEU|nr:glycosyltransferase family 1 protein [Amycolatopsis niigatensis]PKV95911.1 glycosyltransferase involved in cell wall biosynthesis [Amycolatopsis niigatensis]
MRLFGWQGDTQGCGYYRIALPFDALAARGHDAAYSTRMPDAVRDGGVDVVVGQRVCEPGPSGIWQRLAAAGHTKLVFELDDDLWNIDPSNRSSHAFYDADRQRRLIENIRVADAVTVTTEPLAEVVSAWNPVVHVVPNQIPGWLLDHERPVTESVTIGWRGGPSHSRDFGELAKPLRRFLQHPCNRDRVEFHAMGADYTPRVASNRGRTRHTGWTPEPERFLRGVDFDLGVIPLRPSVFNDSKSELALLELAALGIPAIVSDTGPYRRAVDSGAPARRASLPSCWTAALTDLVGDAEARVQLGKEAREWAAGRTVEANVSRWEEAYR